MSKNWIAGETLTYANLGGFGTFSFDGPEEEGGEAP